MINENAKINWLCRRAYSYSASNLSSYFQTCFGGASSWGVTYTRTFLIVIFMLRAGLGIRLFFVSKRAICSWKQQIAPIALFSWATWVNCSQSLFLNERFWAKERRANERRATERKSEFPTLSEKKGLGIRVVHRVCWRGGGQEWLGCTVGLAEIVILTI